MKKDKQPESIPAAYQIPVISPVLHCLSMPVIVFLRTSFGYSYLRPKSVLIALSVACLASAYIVNNEPRLLPDYGWLTRFLGLASILYLLHLMICAGMDLASKGEHDQYSGTPHVLRLLPHAKRTNGAHLIAKLFIEPTTVVISGIAIRSLLDTRLGSLIVYLGVALFLKELIGAWLTLRQQKRIDDLLDDAQDKAPRPPEPKFAGSTRKKKKSRPRVHAEPSSLETAESRHAEVLRLMPPYTLEAAEANFRILIKEAHPDTGGDPTEAEIRTRELTEALEYFRNQG